MKKKILIGLGVIAVIIAALVAYEVLIASKKSPETTANFSDNGLDISVTYCQPSKRGRLIFGDEKDGALQPFGKYWRLGANSATEITFNKNVHFAGQPLAAGTYRMYAIPGVDAFTVTLNSEVDVYFGISEPDPKLDVLSVKAPVTPQASETEMFTIKFNPDSLGVNMDFVWDKTLFRVPISAK